MDINTTIDKLESGEYQRGEILKFERWAEGEDKKQVKSLLFNYQPNSGYNPIHHYSEGLIRLRHKIAETVAERNWAIDNNSSEGIEVCDELLLNFTQLARRHFDKEFRANKYKPSELVWKTIWKYRMFLPVELVEKV